MIFSHLTYIYSGTTETDYLVDIVVGNDFELIKLEIGVSSVGWEILEIRFEYANDSRDIRSGYM